MSRIHRETIRLVIKKVAIDEVRGPKRFLELRPQRNRHKPIARNFMAGGQEHRVLRGPGVGLDPKAGAQNRQTEHDQWNEDGPPGALAWVITMLE